MILISPLEKRMLATPRCCGSASGVRNNAITTLSKCRAQCNDFIDLWRIFLALMRVWMTRRGPGREAGPPTQHWRGKPLLEEKSISIAIGFESTSALQTHWKYIEWPENYMFLLSNLIKWNFCMKIANIFLFYSYVKAYVIHNMQNKIL